MTRVQLLTAIVIITITLFCCGSNSEPLENAVEIIETPDTPFENFTFNVNYQEPPQNHTIFSTGCLLISYCMAFDFHSPDNYLFVYELLLGAGLITKDCYVRDNNKVVSVLSQISGKAAYYFSARKNYIPEANEIVIWRYSIRTQNTGNIDHFEADEYPLDFWWQWKDLNPNKQDGRGLHFLDARHVSNFDRVNDKSKQFTSYLDVFLVEPDKRGAYYDLLCTMGLIKWSDCDVVNNARLVNVLSLLTRKPARYKWVSEDYQPKWNEVVIWRNRPLNFSLQKTNPDSGRCIILL
jgi:hypothetical protein